MTQDTHTPPYPPDILGMEAEEMRRLGYRMVDLVVENALNRHASPAIQANTPEALAQALGGPLPEAPGDADAALDTLARVALANMQHGDHPRYFARVPGPASFAAILGEWLGTGFNTIATSWGGGSGPSTVELVAVRWLAEMLGLPEATEGVLLSGGSLASLTAFATARAEMGPGTAYFTDQTHSSLPRDLRLLGWAADELHMLPVDAGYRMDPARLAAAIQADRARGRTPRMVIATAGTTNTGAIDPLDEIAEICAAHDLWLHVDGAYGAPAAITAQGRALMPGLARADSLVIDPHKWLFQPYDVGACFVTRPGALERTFAMNPEYLRDVKTAPGTVNFGNRSPELSRRSRALKLWMSLTTYGAGRFRAAVARGIANAEFAENYLRQNPARWQVVTPAQIGVVTFALVGADAAEHARRAKVVSDTGYAAVTSTLLNGVSVLRLCTINPLTTEDDIRQTIDRLGAA